MIKEKVAGAIDKPFVMKASHLNSRWGSAKNKKNVVKVCYGKLLNKLKKSIAKVIWFHYVVVSFAGGISKTNVCKAKETEKKLQLTLDAPRRTCLIVPLAEHKA